MDSWLLRGCATLGIKLVHSTPGRPEGRGKVERFFRTVREQFLVELSTPDTEPITDLGQLNRLFTRVVGVVAVAEQAVVLASKPGHLESDSVGGQRVALSVKRTRQLVSGAEAATMFVSCGAEPGRDMQP